MNRGHSRKRGFLLLETMIGVAIFSIGVLAMGRCVQNCIGAEGIQAQDQRARLALENRMAEIEAGAVIVEDKAKAEKLKGMFEGITLEQSRKPFRIKKDKEPDLTGLYIITLAARWDATSGPQEKGLTFYVLRPN